MSFFFPRGEKWKSEDLLVEIHKIETLLVNPKQAQIFVNVK